MGFLWVLRAEKGQLGFVNAHWWGWNLNLKNLNQIFSSGTVGLKWTIVAFFIKPTVNEHYEQAGTVGRESLKIKNILDSI